MDENKKVQKLLETYEFVLGQRINKEKAMIVFSGNVSVEAKKEIKNLWSNCEIQQCER